MAAEEEPRQAEATERFDGGAEAGLILCGAVAGRAVGTELAEGEIAAEDGEAGLAESFG
jgi:hypothetical protein